MSDRRTRAWLLGGAVVGVGVVEGVVFAVQDQLVAAVLAVVVLGLVGWVVSPAAFPRPTAHNPARAGAVGGVVVYWRPGCVYCLRLRWSLGRLARRAAWVDIWADPDAAAFVRGVNDGNETVPTVIADGAVRTNPEVDWVRAALRHP